MGAFVGIVPTRKWGVLFHNTQASGQFFNVATDGSAQLPTRAVSNFWVWDCRCYRSFGTPTNCMRGVSGLLEPFDVQSNSFFDPLIGGFDELSGGDKSFLGGHLA